VQVDRITYSLSYTADPQYIAGFDKQLVFKSYVKLTSAVSKHDGGGGNDANKFKYTFKKCLHIGSFYSFLVTGE
jgi:hypothetical protein